MNINKIFEDTTEGIGKSSDDDIIKKLMSFEGDSNIIIENLKNVANNFCPMKEIMILGQKNIYYDKDDKRKPTSQFQIEIGGSFQHQMVYTERYKDLNTNFIDVLTDFYTSLFTNEEKKHIINALGMKNLLHVVIYCNYYIRSRSDDTVKEYG